MIDFILGASTEPEPHVGGGYNKELLPLPAGIPTISQHFFRIKLILVPETLSSSTLYKHKMSNIRFVS